VSKEMQKSRTSAPWKYVLFMQFVYGVHLQNDFNPWQGELHCTLKPLLEKVSSVVTFVISQNS